MSNDLLQLTDSIRIALATHGIEAVKDAIQITLAEHRCTYIEFQCLNCGNILKVDNTDTGRREGIVCSECAHAFAFYFGKTRSLRRQKGRFAILFTIRCFDIDKSERLIEFEVDPPYGTAGIELKSGDEFFIAITKNAAPMGAADPKIFCKLYFANLTIRTSTIFDIHWREAVKALKCLSA